MKIARMIGLSSFRWLVVWALCITCALAAAPFARAQQALPALTVQLKPIDQQVAVQKRGARVA